MPVNDNLGKRMKENYEMRSRTSLVRRIPVAIRIDGKAFHTFTKGLKKPFDNILVTAMQETTLKLCKNIQGCVFGYTQSDEITLILCDYQNLDTSAWFDYEVQKLTSISASMATLYFNMKFSELVHSWYENYFEEWHHDPNDEKYVDALQRCCDKGAVFDSRCFNIPKEEVTNLIYWRQLDAIRNSIQMVGQSKYSTRQLHGASCEVIKEMLHQDGIEWHNLPIHLQRGSACYKTDEGWIIDKCMPILKDSGRMFVDKHIYFEE